MTGGFKSEVWTRQQQPRCLLGARAHGRYIYYSLYCKKLEVYISVMLADYVCRTVTATEILNC
jgi:hypothetical protein